MNQTETDVVNKLRKAIVAVLKEERLQPKEGLELLSTAFLQIVAATGDQYGYEPKDFALNLLSQMEEALKPQQNTEPETKK